MNTTSKKLYFIFVIAAPALCSCLGLAVGWLVGPLVSSVPAGFQAAVAEAIITFLLALLSGYITWKAALHACGLASTFSTSPFRFRWNITPLEQATLWASYIPVSLAVITTIDLDVWRSGLSVGLTLQFLVMKLIISSCIAYAIMAYGWHRIHELQKD